MNYKTIGVRQLHRQMTQISQDALAGQSFVVMKNARPLFKIIPFMSAASKKYILRDLTKLQFKSKEKNLSKKVDQIIYR